jgi:RHS repeat-associated protein
MSEKKMRESGCPWITGKERDAETGLDYFGARYLSSVQGRWTCPDQPFADQHPQNPQNWNLYTYVQNNPLKYIDPSGLFMWENNFTTAHYESIANSSSSEPWLKMRARAVVSFRSNFLYILQLAAYAAYLSGNADVIAAIAVYGNETLLSKLAIIK